MSHPLFQPWRMLWLVLLTALWTHQAAAQALTVEDDRGDLVVEFTLNYDDLSIRYRDHGVMTRLSSRLKDDKRKYYGPNGALVAEVKSKGDDFKLRADGLNGEIKVKGDIEKLKIVVNGDEKRPVKIKTKDDKLKVYRVSGESEIFIGQAQLSQDRKEIKVKDADKDERYRINDFRLSSAYGLLLDERILPEYRYILMAEILMRQ
ncbi:hypothetical protein ONV78_01640 [Hahella sp. CR1]|uniref:hypothetical protein n=1 Tax=Hahella sp. CR1 TaxID=2992807 RepID=UPI002441207B|nr:hypothetical protein [Hahella sp. CR1]MDG9666418.1 hypothetical protein [Hahella sp. CR1]